MKIITSEMMLLFHRFPASSSGYQPLTQYSFPSFPGFQYTPQSTAPSSTPSLSSLNSPVSQYSALSVTSAGAMPHLGSNSQVHSGMVECKT